MKNLIVSIFTLACVLTFTSCEKETNLTPNPLFNATPSQPQNFQADVNNTTYKFNVETSVESSGYLNLVGVKDSIKLTIVTSATAPGSYKTKDNGLNNVSLYINDGANGIYSSAFVPTPNMEIIITSFDLTNRTISGTLSGLIEDINTNDTIRITNGIFTNIKVLKGPDVNLGSMTAKIDGSAFEAYFCINTNATNNGAQYNQIDGSSTGVSKSIKLLFENEIKVGTYTLDGFEYSAQYFANLSTNTDPFEDIYSADSGTITISKVDTVAKIVVGTFNFEAENGNSKIVKITDGKFEAFIQ